jgi:hypothetical protein
MQKSLEFGHAHPYRPTDSDRRRELPRPDQPVERVGMESETLCGLTNRKQIRRQLGRRLCFQLDCHMIPLT